MYEKLQAYQEEGKTIRVGAVGAGWMGGGFAAAVRHVPGMEISVLADEDVELARSVLMEFGGVDADNIIETDSADTAAAAVLSGKRVVTGDGKLAAKVGPVDIITDVPRLPPRGPIRLSRLSGMGNRWSLSISKLM